MCANLYTLPTFLLVHQFKTLEVQVTDLKSLAEAEVVDIDHALAEASNIAFKTERYGDVARMRLKNKQLILLKPSTYMNLSGNAVRYWKEKENRGRGGRY